jgi:hypothetical protein
MQTGNWKSGKRPDVSSHQQPLLSSSETEMLTLGYNEIQSYQKSVKKGIFKETKRILQ